MNSRNIQRIFVFLTALLITILGAGGALAQGKGRGGDKNGGGQSAQPRGQGGNGERQKGKNERPQAQREQPRQQQRQQPRFESPPVQRQQQQSRKERPQAQREQPNQGSQNSGRQDRGDRGQGWQKEGRVRIEQSRPQQARRPDTVRTEQRRPDFRQFPDNRGAEQRQNRIERGQGNGEVRRQRRDDRNSQAPSQQRQVPWSNAWPNNYGYERSREAHARNAERKAWKNEEKALRRNLRENNWVAGRYVDVPYYQYNRYVYQYPEHRRVNVLRNLIANVLASNVGYNDNYYSQYQPRYYDSPYYPAYYSGNYYNAYPQYQSYAVAPYYYSYQPYGYGYDPQYAGDPFYADNYSDDLQFAYISNSPPGGSFLRQLFSRLLALGYDEGYDAGLNARRAGYGDQYYSDPYAYENTNYVPYSYSLGENRRCLSEGYELGYNDALYDQRGSDPYQNDNVDLVSLLIGSSLQIL